MTSSNDNIDEWLDLQLSLNHLLGPGWCACCGSEKLPTPSFEEQLEKPPGMNFCCQEYYDQLVGCILKLADAKETQPKITIQKEGEGDDDDDDDGGVDDGDDGDDGDDDDDDKDEVEDDRDRIGVRYVVNIMETMNYSRMFESRKKLLPTKHQQQKILCGHDDDDEDDEADDDDGNDDDDDEGEGDDDDDHGNVSWKFHVLETKILSLLKKVETFLTEAEKDYDESKGIHQFQDILKVHSSTVFHPSGHVAMVRLSPPGKNSTGCCGTPDHVIIDDEILCVVRNGGSLVVNHGGKSKISIITITIRLWMNGSESIEFHPDGSTKRTRSNDLPFKKFKVQISPNLTLEVTSPIHVTLNFDLSVPGAVGGLKVNAAIKLGTDFGATKVSGIETLALQMERLKSKFWKVLEKLRRSLG